MSATEAPRAGPGAPGPGARRVEVRVTGTVQGVGFRPAVYRLATGLGLAGWVRNDERGVLIEVEGAGASIGDFLGRLRDEAPPLAQIADLRVRDLEPSGGAGFEIGPSHAGSDADALVAADAATCEPCLAEVRDPANRRFRYPFTNCTNCGPRFTIVRGVPYDRPLTTMAGFEMCAACRAEYGDPLDRRFHAQPNACPECGPQATLVDPRRRALPLAGARDAVEAAAAMLRDGMIVAVKGIGGFHLAARADREDAVATLRRRKHRDDKPFALLAADLERAARLVELTAVEERLLGGRERPIVIARRRAGCDVAGAVAPASPDLGVMLPHSPLHQLLADDAGSVLVMTSGNLADEPICFQEVDALRRLGAVADAFLLHDRPIHTRVDDSVVRAVDPALRSEPIVIRRARGYAPRSVVLAVPAERPLLACGAELKSTLCLAKGRSAWVSQHIGDLKNLETLDSFRESARLMAELFAVGPEVVAHDLHPDYLSTRFALGLEGVERVAVQHHHAHLAAVLAEHGERGPAVGAIFDGAGLGDDGTVWGGEILAGDLDGYERQGMLFPVRLPGGDAAAREPWRMACAWLAAGEERPRVPAALRGSVDESAWEVVADLCRTGVNSPLTTSAGRLFDAVAAICGIRGVSTYEGHAAMELESAATAEWRAGARSPYEFPVPGDVPLILDARPAVAAAVADVGGGEPPGLVAARFHAGLADATARACESAARAAGTEVVVLAGGVFQNRLLLEATAERLGRCGLRVLIPSLLPPNDGAISYGQAAVAAARSRER